MTRKAFIERVRRLIYNGQPSNDATITVGLVNNYLPDAIGYAAKANYKENIALDGIGYVNNSFYSRFTGLSISQDSRFTWKVTLPEVPTGLGRNEGISTLQLVNDKGEVTLPFIALSENQKTYYQGMRPVPNKVLYYYEGNILYALSTILLNEYTANVTMVSGGDSTDLDSNLNVPPDYIGIMQDYLVKYFLTELSRPVDATNDGLDAVATT